jgi:hypothetical protein
MLEPMAPGVWVDSAPVRFLGLHLTANMTVLKLGGDALLVCSPVMLTPERKAAVDALGRVAHLYAPNTYHHLRLGDWSRAYPQARVHAPPGLLRKRPDLRVDRVHGAMAEPDFAGVLDEVRIDGFLLQETVLFHRPSRTLVLADLVHNIGRPTHGWTRVYTTLAGFWGRVALSRVIRLSAFPDRVAARRSVDLMLSLPFERVVVGHGPPLLQDAKPQLERALAWLPAPRALPSGIPQTCG